MANTLETLGGASTVAVHRSGTDQKDKTPLQNYQGATISELVAAARPAQGAEHTDENTSTVLTAAEIATGLLPSTPGDASQTLTFDSSANLIANATLDLTVDNATFQFSIINESGNVLTVAAGTSNTYVGHATLPAKGAVRFMIRRTSSTACTIYRIAG